MTDHTIGTTIMGTARHDNVFVPLKCGENAACMPRQALDDDTCANDCQE